MNRKNMVIGALVVVIIGLLWYMQTTTPSSSTGTSRTPPSNVPTLTASATGTAAAPAEPQANGISYTFNVPGILYEAGAAPRTTSPYWWVDSGAALVIENGIGHTILGALPADDPWRMRYDKNNPVDTDNGYHPQNIFRLVTNGSWMNYTEECYFKIVATNLSASPNRNQSNGLLLFNRYEDHNDLYYAGIRVDGTSVIKKKIGGIYYTMAQNPLFPGIYAETSTSLTATSSPNLIPQGTWIGLRTVVTNLANGNASIKLYMDLGRTGNWIIVAQATDRGQYGGTPPIVSAAHAGIRTDFMDVEFSNFKITAL